MSINDNLLKVIIFLVSNWGIIFGIIYLILIVLKSVYNEKIKISYLAIHLSFAISLILYFFLAMFCQYEIWLKNDFTKILVSQPLLQHVPLPGILFLLRPLFNLSIGYLLHYSLIHFFGSIFFGLSVSFILYFLLRIIRSKKPYLFSYIELNIIFAGSMLFLWPNTPVYLVLLFSIFIIHNVINSLRGNKRTKILFSTILAIAIMLIFTYFYDNSSSILKDLYFIQPR